MNDQATVSEIAGRWPRWFRLGCIGLSVLILCSCRGPMPPEHTQSGRGDTLPRQAFTGQPGDGYTVPGAVPGQPPMVGYSQGPPLPVQVMAPWVPPGIARPWPHDEYLHDGGDRAPLAKVDPDWRVRGLELEDTIVHYDTLDGCTVVEPSNRVHIYAPRFAAVRKVEVVHESGQLLHATGVNTPVSLAGHDGSLPPTTALQQLQPINGIGTKRASVFLDKAKSGGLMTELHPVAFHDGLKPFEDFAIIRYGVFEQADKPRLAEAVDAAIVWTHDTGLQVAIDQQAAQAEIAVQSAHVTYRVDTQGCPRLQVCKVASTQHAKPGELVDFTIRFDNVGDQKMGNVTIVDNLTTRLEYVPDSAQSSLKANFGTARNEGESLVLRWEIIDPIEAGEGGLVRFQCRVR